MPRAWSSCPAESRRPYCWLSGRNGRRAPLAFRRERETSANIFSGELGELAQKLILGCAASQVRQHVTNGNPRATDAWLAEANLCVDHNAVEEGHERSLRESWDPGTSGRLCSAQLSSRLKGTLTQIPTRHQPAAAYPSFSCNTGCTPFGSAFPLLRFITCPTKNAISLVSPPRYLATSAGCAARTSSTQPPSAP